MAAAQKGWAGYSLIWTGSNSTTYGWLYDSWGSGQYVVQRSDGYYFAVVAMPNRVTTIAGSGWADFQNSGIVNGTAVAVWRLRNH